MPLAEENNFGTSIYIHISEANVDINMSEVQGRRRKFRHRYVSGRNNCEKSKTELWT
jgi:hypothetical protein